MSPRFQRSFFWRSLRMSWLQIDLVSLCGASREDASYRFNKWIMWQPDNSFPWNFNFCESCRKNELKSWDSLALFPTLILFLVQFVEVSSMFVCRCYLRSHLLQVQSWPFTLLTRFMNQEAQQWRQCLHGLRHPEKCLKQFVPETFVSLYSWH